MLWAQRQGILDAQVGQIDELQQGMLAVPIHHLRFCDAAIYTQPFVLRCRVQQEKVALTQRWRLHTIEDNEMVGFKQSWQGRL